MMAYRTGQRLGNYQLIRLLGQGGFAEVHLGEHIHLGTQAAIKVLYTQLMLQDSDHFRNEARVVARLAHPHIVRVFDFGIEDTTPFLVMDYAPNGTLRHRYPRGSRLAQEAAVSYVKQIADALQYAHDEKLIHRDVKPENMLIGRRGEILLSDFGIALAAQSSQYQNTQDVAGTMAYSAPEQIQGRPCPASDQYALGIVVYEWLSGDRPFRGSLTELVGQHLTVPPPPLREKLPELSPLLAEVVMTALAKDPRQRFGSVRAFATALEQAVRSFVTPPSVISISGDMPPSPSMGSSGYETVPIVTTPVLSGTQAATVPVSITPVLSETQIETALIAATPALSETHVETVLIPATPALSETHVKTVHIPSRDMRPAVAEVTTLVPTPTPAPPPTRARHALSRRAALITLGGAAGAIAVGGGIAWWVFSPRSPLTLYHGHTSQVNAVTWSPDGRRIASASADHTVQVWNASDGGQAFTYRGHTSQVNAVAWSPDSGRIASASADHTVQVWNASDGGQALIHKGSVDWMISIAWSPDSRHIVSTNDQTVQVWNASDGSPALTCKGSSGWMGVVTWSRDSRYVASTSDQVVQVWNASDGSPALTYKGQNDWVRAIAWSPDSRRIASASGQIIQVWNVRDGSVAFTYKGHTAPVTAVAWSPDSRRIASTSEDQTVQVWNASDGSHVFTYKGHVDWTMAVAWSPDSSRIASGSADQTVQVWEAG